MKLLVSVFSLMWAISASAAEPQVEKPVKDELRVQGTWTLVSVRHEGEKVPKEKLTEMRCTITDKHITIGKVGQDPMGFEYTLDATKTPKAIDTTHELDPGKPILHRPDRVPHRL